MRGTTRWAWPAARLAPIVLMLGLLSPPAPAARAQEGGSVTIRTAACPPGRELRVDLVADCYPNPVAGVTFTAWGPEGYHRTAATRADGVAVFGGILVGGSVYLGEDAPHPIAVYCSDAAGAAVPVEYTDTAPGADVVLVVGGAQHVACDWYILPPAEAEGAQQPVPATRLPDTGAGAAARQGPVGRAALLAAVLTALTVGGAVGVRLAGRTGQVRAR